MLFRSMHVARTRDPVAAGVPTTSTGVSSRWRPRRDRCVGAERQSRRGGLSRRDQLNGTPLGLGRRAESRWTRQQLGAARTQPDAPQQLVADRDLKSPIRRSFTRRWVSTTATSTATGGTTRSALTVRSTSRTRRPTWRPTNDYAIGSCHKVADRKGRFRP